LGGGAVIAALAIGITLTYRVSGVINFAYAATGMYVAYAYFEFRATGDLVLPVIGLPDRLHLLRADPPPTVASSMLVALLLAAAMGLAFYWLIFRPLRAAPDLAKVVASLGLFLYLLALASTQFGNQGASTGRVQNVLPTETVDLLGATLPRDRLLLALLVAVVTAVLWAVFRFTRFGLATRASAESEKGALLVGISPDLLGSGNWVLASVLAGAAVILFAPIAGLNPTTTSLLIVPALAAALLGGFQSFGITLAAGLGLGMLQSEILKLQSDISWLPDVGLQQGLPFIVILLVLALRGKSLPTRGTLITGRFPRSPVPRHPAVTATVVAAAAIVGLLVLDSDLRFGIINTTIAALIALSVVVLTGYVGQISLAPFAFAGIAAFATAKLAGDLHVPFPIAPLLAALIATGVGILVGLPAVRVRGMNLAIATLAAAVAVEELLFKWSWFTGGLSGTGVPTPEIFGFDLGITDTGDAFPRPAFGIVCVVVTALAAVAVAHLRQSPTGRRWLAVRANEQAAAAAGVDVTKAKLSAFAFSSFLAGLGGTLLAYATPNALSVDSFGVFESLAILSLTYIGGIASVAGAFVAGVISQGGLLTAVTSRSGGDPSELQFALNGLVLIVVAVLFPDGVTGLFSRATTRVKRLRATPTTKVSSES
jgi:ABC-type branched-subunit amino acid transport system permease subunit